MQEFITKLGEWETLVIAYLPMITAVLSMILTVVKTINISKDSSGKMLNGLNRSTEELRVVKNENVQLKQQIQQLNISLDKTNEKLDKLLSLNDKVVK